MNAAVIIENALQALYTGLILGSLYGLMCVGLALIFSVMRVINFAQGEFLMLGMYAAFFAFTQARASRRSSARTPAPVVAAIIAGVVVFVVGVVLYELLLRRVTGLEVAGAEGEGHYPQLTLTLGLSLMLSNGGLILFGSIAGDGAHADVFERLGAGTALRARRHAVPQPGAHGRGGRGALRRRGDGGLHRAGARRQDAARRGRQSGSGHLHGHPTSRASTGSRSRIGAGVTAIAGGLVATYYPFQPYIGIEFVIVMYAGVVLGGMGSVGGAFWGGLTIGLVQQLSTLVLPQQLQNAAIFVAFLLIILLRPQGLFGRNVERV